MVYLKHVDQDLSSTQTLKVMAEGNKDLDYNHTTDGQ